MCTFLHACWIANECVVEIQQATKRFWSCHNFESHQNQSLQITFSPMFLIASDFSSHSALNVNEHVEHGYLTRTLLLWCVRRRIKRRVLCCKILQRWHGVNEHSGCQWWQHEQRLLRMLSDVQVRFPENGRRGCRCLLEMPNQAKNCFSFCVEVSAILLLMDSKFRPEKSNAALSRKRVNWD